MGLVCEGYMICRVVEGMEQVDWKYWNGISSRIPRLGIADECGMMIERVMKCE